MNTEGDTDAESAPTVPTWYEQRLTIGNLRPFYNHTGKYMFGFFTNRTNSINTHHLSLY